MALAPCGMVIDDTTSMGGTLFPSNFGRGYVPRDFAVDPPTMFADPSGIQDMSFTEIADRIKEHEKHETSLRHIRRRRGPNGGHIPALDQNGQGYCWFYSVTATVMYVRARNNQPYVRLSAHSGAAVIKNFRDEGGWCGLGARFIRGQDPNHSGKGGVVPVSHWPEKSMSRTYDTSANWAEAKKYLITEDWVDLARPVYSQNLTKKQQLIQLVLNNPVASDYNWWAHSVCLLWATLLGNPTNPVLEDFGVGGVNSWTDGWGDLGEFELRGSKSLPDGAVCTRNVTGG